MTGPIVLIGDVMIDVTARVASALHYASDTPARIDMQPGGAATNTARWLAACGEPSVLIGAIGNDAAGSIILETLTAEGIDARLFVIDQAPTGACIVIVDQTGERTMLPDPGANTALTPDQVRMRQFPEGGHLHLSGYTLLNPRTRAAGLEAARWARDAGGSVSLDPASAAPLAAQPGALDAVLESCDALTANAAEAMVLTGRDNPDDALEVLASTIPLVVVKLGGAGAIAARGAERVRVPALDAPVIDTTGAGDAFAAGFLTAWRARVSLDTAVHAGHEVAALAVSRVGAGPEPTSR